MYECVYMCSYKRMPEQGVNIFFLSYICRYPSPGFMIDYLIIPVPGGGGVYLIHTHINVYTHIFFQIMFSNLLIHNFVCAHNNHTYVCIYHTHTYTHRNTHFFKSCFLISSSTIWSAHITTHELSNAQV